MQAVTGLPVLKSQQPHTGQTQRIFTRPLSATLSRGCGSPPVRRKPATARAIGVDPRPTGAMALGAPTLAGLADYWPLRLGRGPPRPSLAEASAGLSLTKGFCGSSVIHSAHAARRHARCTLGLRSVANHGLGGDQQPRNRGGILQRYPHDLGRIDNPGRHHVFIIARLRVKAVIRVILVSRNLSYRRLKRF